MLRRERNLWPSLFLLSIYPFPSTSLLPTTSLYFWHFSLYISFSFTSFQPPTYTNPPNTTPRVFVMCKKVRHWRFIPSIPSGVQWLLSCVFINDPLLTNCQRALKPACTRTGRWCFHVLPCRIIIDKHMHVLKAHLEDVNECVVIHTGAKF